MGGDPDVLKKSPEAHIHWFHGQESKDKIDKIMGKDQNRVIEIYRAFPDYKTIGKVVKNH